MIQQQILDTQCESGHFHVTLQKVHRLLKVICPPFLKYHVDIQQLHHKADTAIRDMRVLLPHAAISHTCQGKGKWGTHSFLSVRGSLCHDNIQGAYLSIRLLEVKARVTKRREEILFEKFTNPAGEAVNRVQPVVECVKYCHIDGDLIPQHQKSALINRGTVAANRVCFGLKSEEHIAFKVNSQVSLPISYGRRLQSY